MECIRGLSSGLPKLFCFSDWELNPGQNREDTEFLPLDPRGLLQL
jgi:hypothetical protein